ncbi:unnamed protein product [Ectocarpus sp. 6 AP-2014]
MGSSEGGRSAAAVSSADRIRRWRVPEFVGVVVGLAVVSLVQACFSEYEQFVPENNKEGINGFPVGLGAEWCTASDLSSCAIQSESGCCKEMQAGKSPHETVDEFQLWFVYFVIPAAFVAVRQVLTKLGLYRGAASLADVILGLVFCLGLSVTLTDAIKFMVGRPRPNYAALRALVEYGGSNMMSLKAKSIRSFPSGHSSMSMAGMFYVTLVCWGDLSRFAAENKSWRRSLLAYLSICPILISIYVGVSRIRDFWHFQDDVVAGWALGAASAALAVRWVTFSEAFWTGGKTDRYGVVAADDGLLQHKGDNGGGMQLIMGGRDYDSGSDDGEGGGTAVVGGATGDALA